MFSAYDTGIADRSTLHKNANAELDANLQPGEVVEVIINGASNQAIIGTDRRAFVYKKGFLAGATFGAEMTSWDYRNLVGVQLHTGMMTGTVILQGPGQSGTKTSYWAHGDGDPYKAPNAIPISRPFDDAKAGVASLRQLVETAHRGATTAQGAAASSVADELMKLAVLRDSGVLSEQEFVAMKAKIVGS